MKLCGIYKVVNKINQNFYVGKSVDLKKRFAGYFSPSNNKGDRTITKAFKKYGKENFDFEIIEYCELNVLNDREKYYISLLKPQYNMNQGGEGNYGHKVTEDVKEVLRKKAKTQWENKTEEQKRFIIQNNLKGPKLGHLVSVETKEKIRQANLGKKQSIETKNKRLETVQKNPHKYQKEHLCKKIYCIETNEVYRSSRVAAKALNLDRSAIIKVLKNKTKHTKNYHFKYCNVETNCDECNSVGRINEQPLEVRGNLKKD